MSMKFKNKEELIASLVPGVSKSFFEQPEIKELLEKHEAIKNVNVDDLQGRKETKYIQASRFMRALAQGNQTKLKEINEEQHDAYFKHFYGMYGDDIEKKALTTYLNETVGAEGQYLVPLEYYVGIFEIICAYGVARRECLNVPVARQEMKLNSITGLPTTYWIGEKAKKTESKPTFDQKALKPEKQIALIPFSEEVLADATPPLIALLVRLTGRAMMAGEDAALWSGAGTGVCGGAGVGILNDTNVYTVPMDAGQTSFEDITYKHLLALADAVDCESDEGGSFYLNKNILRWLREQEDLQGRPILQPANAGEPPQLVGYPFIKSSKLPGNAADATDTPFMVFGNLKNCVAFGDRQAMAVKLLTEATISDVNLAVYDLQALRFVERVDIEIMLPKGISVLKTHA